MEVEVLEGNHLDKEHPRQRARARRWAECLRAQTVWEGGTSQGGTERKRRRTERRRSRPMVWLPTKVPSLIFTTT